MFHLQLLCSKYHRTYSNLAVVDELREIQLLHLARHRVLDLCPQLPHLELQRSSGKLDVWRTMCHCHQGSARQQCDLHMCHVMRFTCLTVAPYHAPLSGQTMCTVASNSSLVMSRRLSFRNTLVLRRAFLVASSISAEHTLQAPCRTRLSSRVLLLRACIAVMFQSDKNGHRDHVTRTLHIA
jgi:hypothetical protein